MMIIRAVEPKLDFNPIDQGEPNFLYRVALLVLSKTIGLSRIGDSIGSLICLVISPLITVSIFGRDHRTKDPPANPCLYNNYIPKTVFRYPGGVK